MSMVSVSQETEDAVAALKTNAPIWVHDSLGTVLTEAQRIAHDTGWAGQSSRNYEEAMTEAIEKMKLSVQEGLDMLSEAAEQATAAIRDAGGNY